MTASIREALSDPELKCTQVELEAALSNSREARQVVFDLFQDLNGFQPRRLQALLGRVVQSDRLVRFLSAAVVDRQQKLVKVDDATCDLVTAEGTCHARFTLSREAATHQDNLQLMGLDHPVGTGGARALAQRATGRSRHCRIGRRGRTDSAIAVDS